MGPVNGHLTPKQQSYRTTPLQQWMTIPLCILGDTIDFVAAYRYMKKRVFFPFHYEFIHS